ncbi:hypothetical protein [Oceanobacillus sp. CF4.6]|uniref:hypothetical protein n=1 Tax=Oceanobacillus sp. CF4.6 TaxID=3373080 RepID=UPI003EE67F18
MSKLKFMEACLQGEALLEEIDDYVDEWHDSDSDEEIYDYLGMTIEEYGVWVEDDSMLKTIFYSREIGQPITNLIRENDTSKLVARAANPEEAMRVKEWLQRTGRLS